MNDGRIKRLIMSNLPYSQDRVSVDSLVSDAFIDLSQIGDDIQLHDVFIVLNKLHDEQHLFIFKDGTVAATRKGLDRYE